MTIQSQIFYEGKHQPVRIEKAERIPSWYVFIGNESGFKKVRQFNGVFKSEEMDEQALEVVACMIMAAYG